MAALLLAGANAAKMLAEFDLPWHLAFGREIASTWSVPRVDDFAYTHTAIRYVGVVIDLFFYALARVGGPLALQLSNGLLVIGIAATIVWNAKLRVGSVKPIVLAVAGVVMVGMGPWTFVRPSTVGFFLTGLTLLLVKIGTRRALVAAAVLMPIWCNIHGSVTLGVGIVALHAIDRARRRDGFPAVCAVAGGLLACLNPAGIGLYRGGTEVGSYDDILVEWHPTSLKFFTADSPAAGVALLLCFVLVVAGKNERGGRAPSLFDAVLVVGAAVMATRTRFVPVALVLLAPIAASRAAALVRDTNLMRFAFVGAAMMTGPAVAILHDGTFGVGWDPKSFPEPATAFVATAKPVGNMWNFWPFGGYLIWRLYPEHRVLIDGRIGFVHDRELIYDVLASDQSPDAWSKLDARYDFQWAMCASNEVRRTCTPIARSSEWRMVFLDSMSTVYVRVSGPNARLAERGYRMLTHLTPPERILSAALSGDRGDDLAHDAALLREQDPTSARSWFVDACGALAVGDRARFDVARARLALLAPGHPALAVLGDAAAAKWP